MPPPPTDSEPAAETETPPAPEKVAPEAPRKDEELEEVVIDGHEVVEPEQGDEGDDQQLSVGPKASDSTGVPTGPEVAMESVLLFTIVFASTITMIAASRNCDTKASTCDNEDAFAVCVGLISAVLCTTMFFLNMFKCSKAIHDMAAPFFGVFLFIWWLCGVGAGTFEAPFKHTSNGYFAEWLGFFCSLYYMIVVVPPLARLFNVAHQKSENAASEQRWAGLLTIFALIEVVQSLVECTDHDICTDEYLWALICGGISALITMIYIPLHEKISNSGASKYIGYFLVLHWVFGAGVLTFDKPFTVTGNGYFACWGSVLASLMFALEAGQHALPVPVRKPPSAGPPPVGPSAAATPQEDDST